MYFLQEKIEKQKNISQNIHLKNMSDYIFEMNVLAIFCRKRWKNKKY
jgi:hypothetical protein